MLQALSRAQPAYRCVDYLNLRSQLTPALVAQRAKYRCSSSTATPAQAQPVLLVYSKPDCPLCDHLKAKVESVLTRTAFTDSPLRGVQLQARNILDEDCWFQAYQYEIPVLSWLLPGGQEVPIPRPAPRLSVERLEQHLAAVLASA